MNRNGFCFLVDKLPRRLTTKPVNMMLDTTTASAVAVLLFLNDPQKTVYEKSEYIVSRLLKRNDNSRPTVAEAIETLGITEEELSSILLDYLSGYPKACRLDANGSRIVADKVFNKKGKTIKPDYDWVQDSPAIISAMRQVYGLSLDEVKNLHYWEFLALFNSLPEGTFFSKVLSVRNMKIDPKDSPEKRSEIKKAQRVVGLVDTRTKAQKEADRQAQFDALEL